MPNQETTTPRPLATALAALTSRLNAADKAWRECECCDGFDRSTCPHLAEVTAAQDAYDVARFALIAANEPRDWTLTQDDRAYDIITAATEADALAIARERSVVDFDDEEPRTTWTQIRVNCALTHEQTGVTLAVDPPEPRCEAANAHDWRSPFELVGGDEQQNPGVFGCTGGVRIHSVCMACGCERIVDRFASCPINSYQAIEATLYRPRRFADAIEYMREEIGQ